MLEYIKPILFIFSCVNAYMPKIAPKITCSKNDIIKLEQIAKDNSNERVSQRASMVLRCINGDRIKDIASSMNERPNTVIYWRERFTKQGILGLYNQPRGSSYNVYGSDFKSRLLAKLKSPPPLGCSKWTGSLLASDLNVPPDVVWRYLRKNSIKISSPNRSHQFSLSLPLILNIKQENLVMNKKNEKMDLEFIARVTGKDGSIIEKKVLLKDVLPNLDDFDLETKEGFLRDFDGIEKAIIQARNQVTEDITSSYLDEISKKKKTENE